MVNARAFKPLPLCSGPQRTLMVGISGALAMTESHFVSKNVFSENDSGVSQKWCMLEFSNLCHCVQHYWKVTGRDFWSSRNDRKPLSKQTCVLRKCCGVSQKWWVLELSNLCHCIQHYWKLTGRDFWSYRNEKKSHFLSRHVFWKNAVGYLRNGAC